MTRAQTSWRTHTAAAVLAVLVIWPLVHMPLSRALGFSPWKLGGFGMFSAGGDWMDGAVRVDVSVLDHAAPVPRGPALAAFVRALGERRHPDDDQLPPLVSIERGSPAGFAPATLALGSSDAAAALAKHAENVMLWPRLAYVRGLARAVASALSPDATRATVLITRTTSRVDLAHRRHAVEACTFAVTVEASSGAPIEPEALGCLRSD